MKLVCENICTEPLNRYILTRYTFYGKKVSCARCTNESCSTYINCTEGNLSITDNTLCCVWRTEYVL